MVVRVFTRRLQTLGPVEVGPLHGQQGGDYFNVAALVGPTAQIAAVVQCGGQVLQVDHILTGQAACPKGFLKQAFFAAQPQMQKSHSLSGGVKIGGLGGGQTEQNRPILEEQMVLIEVGIERILGQSSFAHLLYKRVCDHLPPQAGYPVFQVVAQTHSAYR